MAHHSQLARLEDVLAACFPPAVDAEPFPDAAWWEEYTRRWDALLGDYDGDVGAIIAACRVPGVDGDPRTYPDRLDDFMERLDALLDSAGA